MPKPSETSKYIKARHFKGKNRELTISHVGMEKGQKKKDDEVLFLAGDGSENPLAQAEWVKVLYFKETGLQKMRLNDTNLEVLTEKCGDDFKAWIGARVTFQPTEIFAFGKKQGSFLIAGVKPRDAKAAKTEAGVKEVNPQTGEITVADWTTDKTELEAFGTFVKGLGFDGGDVKDILQVAALRDYKGTRTQAEQSLRDAHAAMQPA